MVAKSRRPATWGWHQLDPEWARRIVDGAGVDPGDLVLDVGAGKGALTEPLVERGARVVAVELHPGRAAELRRRFGSSIVVVQADAADLRLPRQPFRVVANPPFQVTSALLRRLLQPGSKMVSADIVVQHQVARRWSSPSAPGVNRWARRYQVDSPHGVPRSAFRPRPKVNTRLLHFERR